MKIAALPRSSLAYGLGAVLPGGQVPLRERSVSSKQTGYVGWRPFESIRRQREKAGSNERCLLWPDQECRTLTTAYVIDDIGLVDPLIRQATANASS